MGERKIGTEEACLIGLKEACSIEPEEACSIGSEEACSIGPKEACLIGPEEACSIKLDFFVIRKPYDEVAQSVLATPIYVLVVLSALKIPPVQVLIVEL